jgi:hypothetical protein
MWYCSQRGTKIAVMRRPTGCRKAVDSVGRHGVAGRRRKGTRIYQTFNRSTFEVVGAEYWVLAA